MHKITTAKRKTPIFTLLAHKEAIRKFDSRIYRDSFKMRKTRKRRRARNATSELLATKKKEMYLGIKDSKSITPKKLVAYFHGFLTTSKRAMYSMVKRMVIPHSN